MLKPIDRWLNGTTMYLLLLCGLGVLLAQGVALAAAGRLPFGAGSLLVSIVLIAVSAQATNFALAKLYGTKPSWISTAIMAMILALVAAPPESAGDAVPLVLLGVLASASKYIVAVRGRHIFNPAAIALVILGLVGAGIGTWWVGNPTMLPLVAILAFLVARKLGRTTFVAVGIVSGMVSIAVSSAVQGLFDTAVFAESLTSWPLVFFAGIMLTEPQTAPATRRWRLAYAAVAGLIFGSQLHLGPVSATPEVALVAANILAFATNGGRRASLRYIGRKERAPHTFEYVFEPDRPMPFRPGQYFEWSLAHRSADARGIRRYFTVASAPLSPNISLGIRIPDRHPSSFKAGLDAMDRGDRIEVTGPYGDFVLPADVASPQLWIAGGIGITPFVSMARSLAATPADLDIILVYIAASASDFAFKESFDVLAGRGLTVHYLVRSGNGQSEVGKVRELVPDIVRRRAYVAGSSQLVRSGRSMLRTAGLARAAIHTDDFPGL